MKVQVCDTVRGLKRSHRGSFHRLSFDADSDTRTVERCFSNPRENV